MVVLDFLRVLNAIHTVLPHAFSRYQQCDSNKRGLLAGAAAGHLSSCSTRSPVDEAPGALSQSTCSHLRAKPWGQGACRVGGWREPVLSGAGPALGPAVAGRCPASLDLDGSVLELHLGLQGGLQGLGRLQEGTEEGFSIKVPTNSSPGHSGSQNTNPGTEQTHRSAGRVLSSPGFERRLSQSPSRWAAAVGPGCGPSVRGLLLAQVPPDPPTQAAGLPKACGADFLFPPPLIAGNTLEAVNTSFT